MENPIKEYVDKKLLIAYIQGKREVAKGVDAILEEYCSTGMTAEHCISQITSYLAREEIKNYGHIEDSRRVDG